MASLPNLITVAEFLEMPDGGELAYELHHGEVVASTRPKWRHTSLQRKFLRLLEPRMEAFGGVTIELPFRAVRSSMSEPPMSPL